MPIGYQRGNTYHLHHAGDRYMELPIFKLLTDYAMKRKFGTHISWTHITRAYDVDLREIVYFKHSGQPYMMSRANRGGANPLEALVAAIQVALPPTPLLRALCLEAEVVLLGMAVDDWKVLEAKIEKVCDDLADCLRRLELVEPVSADPSDVAAAHWENIQSGAIPAPYDEDDDL